MACGTRWEDLPLRLAQWDKFLDLKHKNPDLLPEAKKSG